MQRILVLFLALTMIAAAPCLAGSVSTAPKVHVMQVYQVCAATSTCTCSVGYSATPGDRVIAAAPGVLCIDPGVNWSRFVQAAQVSGQSWTIKTVSLTKDTPAHIQCVTGAGGVPIFPVHRVTQLGTPSIRLWRPLMYELPGTTFTLSILYGTPNMFDDDGPGPNPKATVHQEQWVWQVDANLDSLILLLKLFRESPYGQSEVSLIQDEVLYNALLAKLTAANTYLKSGKLALAASVLADFELEVMDACDYDIANTDENPACCKLLIDVEYILAANGIGQSAR
jgi:hypothetical protein